MKTRLMPSPAVLLALALSLVLAGLSFTASAACSGKYASLASYAGKPAGDSHFFDEPVIVARLQALGPGVRENLRKYFAASGPIRLVDCHLMLSGSVAGRWFEMLDFDLANGILTRATSFPKEQSTNVELVGDPAAASPTATWRALPEGVRRWVVEAYAGFPKQPPASLAMPHGVYIHAAPNAAQIAAIRRAAGSDLKNCTKHCFDVELVNLNNDGRPDLLAMYTGATGLCGSAGCAGIVVMTVPGGYSTRKISLPNAPGYGVLPTRHHGVHDLQQQIVVRGGRLMPGSVVLKWNGTDYR